MGRNKIRDGIQDYEWSYCLFLSREARSLILRDAESFHAAATALEQIGKILSGEIRNGLGKYRSELIELMEFCGKDNFHENERLFEVVKNARNMAVHEGSFARHLSSRLIDIFLILEEAIMKKLQRVEDIMVRNPVFAESWHMVANARREMLANSFSFLPIFHDGKWQLLSDSEVMRFIRKPKTPPNEVKNKRLSTRLDMAISMNALSLAPAITCEPADTIVHLLEIIAEHPVLVVKEIDGKPNLLGIVTSFDLL